MDSQSIHSVITFITSLAFYFELHTMNFDQMFFPHIIIGKFLITEAAFVHQMPVFMDIFLMAIFLLKGIKDFGA